MQQVVQGSVVSRSENEIVAVAQGRGAAGAEAKARLCDRFRPLVRRAIRNLRVPRWLAEDAEQAGYLGLMEAIHRFNTALGTSFASFASKFVYGAVREAAYGSSRSAGRFVVQQLPLDDDLDGTSAGNGGRRAAAASRCGPEPCSEPPGDDETTRRLIAFAMATATARAATAEAAARENPFVVLDVRRSEEAVRAFVGGLSEAEQDLLRARFWEEESQAEMARQSGTYPMNVGRALRRIYARGRTVLGACRDSIAA